MGGSKTILRYINYFRTHPPKKQIKLLFNNKLLTSLPYIAQKIMEYIFKYYWTLMLLHFQKLASILLYRRILEAKLII